MKNKNWKQSKIIKIKSGNYTINPIYGIGSHLISRLVIDELSVFFKNDIKEKNTRLSLNFGHTFAHAMEMITDKILKKDYLRHGEAVGLGMLCEIMMSGNKLLWKRFFQT